MRIKRDEAFEAWLAAADEEGFGGARAKERRAEALSPGGRVELTLFESVDGGRPHPRLQLGYLQVPAEAAELLEAPEQPPLDAASFEAWLRERWTAAAEALKPDFDGLPKESRRYHANAHRITATRSFFAKARGLLADWEGQGLEDAGYALRALEDEAYGGSIPFDDDDTGTYHSFGHDKPFVHYLEVLLHSLPAEGSRAMALLDGNQQEAVRRQRAQTLAHLDHLMRHKYAHDGVSEADIERSVGAFLVDRDTRMIVSETPDSAHSVVPSYELLRIEPQAEHPHAGAWVYRSGEGFRLQPAAWALPDPEGADAVEVDEALLRKRPVDADRLSFLRAPHHPGLRAGTRLDWDRNGYVQPDPIGWVDWAGHCDIKAVMEAVGLSLTPNGTEPWQVLEFRSDTLEHQLYTRDLLVEMVASALELGSLYRRLDGSGQVRRGVHRFGGARNDSRPDRIQFQGKRRGEGFRWPLGGRQEKFQVVGIQVAGEEVDPGRAFYRYLPDEEHNTFSDNPRWLKTVEGDYGLIDVSHGVLEVSIQEDSFHERTGYPVTTTTRTTLDLREDSEVELCYLGTHIQDPARREVYKVHLNRRKERIEAVLYRYEREDEKYVASEVRGKTVEIPLEKPLTVTLSREMKRDDPQMFQTLLDQSLRSGEGICADTDMKSEVWNGVVTHIASRRVAENREARTERWRVDLRARFGSATLEYLVRRDAAGEPQAWCPVLGEDASQKSPDFLWQDLPDVSSKAFEGGDWLVNDTMVERGIVTLARNATVDGGFYVYDEHIKNLFELIFCGLGGSRYTLVHNNKRYAFEDAAAWVKAVSALWRKQHALSFED